MNSFKYILAVSVLLAVHFRATASLVEDANEIDLTSSLRARTCTKLTTTFSQTSVYCGPQKSQITITATAILPPATQVVAITLACTKGARGNKIATRVIKCIKLLTARCRCLDPYRKEECLYNQIVICAGRNTVTELH